mmetsp:Transcript_103413/g.163381  ORF Transcript_103413/g.163381 Transcript_103413/m.163381 type:complete len:173 (-) Transcript_103413:99-617(-)
MDLARLGRDEDESSQSRPSRHYGIASNGLNLSMGKRERDLHVLGIMGKKVGTAQRMQARRNSVAIRRRAGDKIEVQHRKSLEAPCKRNCSIGGKCFGRARQNHSQSMQWCSHALGKMGKTLSAAAKHDQACVFHKRRRQFLTWSSWTSSEKNSNTRGTMEDGYGARDREASP